MIEVIIDDSGFKEFVNRFQKITYIISNMLSNFASILEMNTSEYVPLKTGKLEDSFQWRINSTSNFVQLNVSYSAISDNGYDYADIQHRSEDFEHPIRGTHAYLTKGIRDSTGTFFTMMETDFLSLFGRK